MQPANIDTKTPQKAPPSFWLHFSAGGLAGTIGAAATCPLEVVKTRLQSSLYQAPAITTVSTGSKNPVSFVWSHIRGVVTLLNDIYTREGLRALWKGLGPNLVGVVPARSIHFAVYTQSKHFLTTRWGKETSTVHMLSAGGASATTSLITNPIWLVKTRMQLQNQTAGNPLYRNAFHCAYHVTKTEGIRALYKGFTASLMGLGESALQFVVYEGLKKKVNDGRGPEYRYKLFGCASAAKLIATLSTYPHEVLRTRLRQTPGEGGKSKYTSIVQATRLIWREEGGRAFYGGMTAHVMRVVPNAALLFLSYETIVYYCRKHKVFE